MVERGRRVKCDKCGAPVDQLVDDMYVEGQTRGVDEPYDTVVLRSQCTTPGCPGPDNAY